MPTSLTIGSRPDCDFVLRASTVSGRHCRLTRDSAGYLLEDLNSTNGTFFNGQRVLGSIPITLAPGDTIHLGSHPLSVDQILPLFDRGPTAASTSTASGPTPTLSLRSAETVIGRSQECDQVIDLPMVSARHARIFRSGDLFLIEDLGSSNGTYVNGNRIAGPVVVAAGDQIALGSMTFVLDTASWRQDTANFLEPGGATTLPGPPATAMESGQAAASTKDHGRAAGIARIPGHPWRLAALLIQSPVLALLIVGLLGGRSPAPILFGLALGVLWFGISSAVLSGLVDRRSLRSGLTHSAAPLLLSRLTVAGAVCVIQCLLVWITVTKGAPLGAPWLATLAFLLLASTVGMALGLLIIALAPRPAVAWMVLPAVMLVLSLFGGISPPLLRIPIIPDAVPSRWAFEGLLLLESGANPEGDLAQGYFSAETQQMGLTADIMALSFTLIGLLAAVGFISTSMQSGPRGLPAS